MTARHIALRYRQLDGPPDFVALWRAAVPRDAERAIHVMAEYNAALFRSGAWAPDWRSLRYAFAEPDGAEELLSAPLLHEAGEGDCEDLVAYRLGELWAAGERGAKARVVRVGDGLWHAVVVRGDGRVEDVSQEVGLP